MQDKNETNHNQPGQRQLKVGKRKNCANHILSNLCVWWRTMDDFPAGFFYGCYYSFINFSFVKRRAKLTYLLLRSSTFLFTIRNNKILCSWVFARYASLRLRNFNRLVYFCNFHSDFRNSFRKTKFGIKKRKSVMNSIDFRKEPKPTQNREEKCCSQLTHPFDTVHQLCIALNFVSKFSSLSSSWQIFKFKQEIVANEVVEAA